MKYISDQSLLSVWEFGLNHSVLETNLVLLSYAYPSYDFDQIASFSIGERDARLLFIRKKLFGQILQNTSNCTACGQKIEWETSVDELELQSINEEARLSPIDLNYKKRQISFRLPNSKDILELKDQDNMAIQEQQLIRNCIVASTLTSKQIENIPKDLKNKIVQKMEEIDPQANIVMNLSCPECENTWNANFDIVQYLWTELNDWAVQLMQDVYVLASNFGWAEQDILEMNRFRRGLYLAMTSR